MNPEQRERGTEQPARRVAIIGGGVIGGGWAARFALNGWHVNVFDPAENAASLIEAVLGNARRVLPMLYERDLPTMGTVTLCQSLDEAVDDVQWIQESIPEQLALKHRVRDEIEALVPADLPIASSTSGFRPSELGDGARHPERLLVAHPFNRVYLLPLVELVGSDAVQLRRASEILGSIGMHPMILARENDAHIADRLLEAVWREALWLVKDGYASTTEIDDAIRYGFGLRWAQMGLFETYRIAGGEGGMAHFIRQFGPCLAWPWTRLTDVPDLDEALVTRIADQSDEAVGTTWDPELEQLRDNNLVAILRALKQQDSAAGAADPTARKNAARSWRAIVPEQRDYQGRASPDLFRIIRIIDQCKPHHPGGLDRLQRAHERRAVRSGVFGRR